MIGTDATRILLVDDDTKVLQILQKNLSSDFIVDAIDDSRNVERYLDSYTPSVILLDHKMPFRSGLEVCESIRRYEEHASTPIVIVSARVDKELKSRFYDIGVSDVIPKPFEIEELKSKLRVWINLSRTHHALANEAMELTHKIQFDHLTNAYTRPYGLDIIEREFDRFRRYGSITTLLFLDIDDFKLLNDRCGHQHGDMALCAFSNRIRTLIRKSDAFIRYGGDEFLLLLTNTTAQQAFDASAKFTRVPHSNTDCPIAPNALSVSIGICQIFPECRSVSDWIHSADKALLQAKQFRKGTAVIHDGGESATLTNIEDLCEGDVLLHLKEHISFEIILAVDDPAVEEALQEALTPYHRTVKSFRDHSSAIAYIRDRTLPCVVFSQCHSECAVAHCFPRQYRQRAASRTDYIIMIISPDQRERALDIVDAGANDYLTTPLVQNEILLRVRIASSHLSQLINLNQIANRYRQLSDFVSSAILTIDPLGKITYANAYAQTMFGMPPHSLLGQNLIHKHVTSSRDARIATQNIQELMGGETCCCSFDIRCTTADGRKIWSRWDISLIERETDYTASPEILCLINDATEDRKERTELMRDASLSSVSLLAAGIAHHFNNINAGITGYSDFILRDQTLPQQTLKYAGNIRQASDRITDIVRRLTSFTRGPTLLGPQIILGEIVQSIYQIVRLEIEKQGVQISISGSSKAKSTASSPDITQIVLSLIQNAADAVQDASEKRITLALSETKNHVQQEVLPNLFNQTEVGGTCRGWVAGCSTGEEAYTIAILLLEHMESLNVPRTLKVFASDIDAKAIEIAARGIYPESIAADIPERFLSKYFFKTEHGYKANRHLRESIIFARHDVTSDPPFTEIHIVTCRNLLIYFKPQAQKRIISMFSYSLRNAGILMLGTSESLGTFETKFSTLSPKFKVFKASFHMPSVEPDLSFSHRTPGRPLSPLIRSGRGRYAQDVDAKVSYTLLSALLQRLCPSCVLVDADYQILHILGDVSPYIRLPSGPPTHWLLSLAPKELSGSLGAALHQASKKKVEVMFSDVQWHPAPGSERRTDIRVIPIPFSGDDKWSYAVIFRDSEKVSAEADLTVRMSGASENTEHMHDLEFELQQTKESLQSTIEELETSNEELQATNEELLSSNEELQSTNEELQSVNEELYSVNSEHQGKISEMSELTSDFEHLLHGIKVGAIFLDANLRVRKFSSSASAHMHILPQDIGRPIAHLTHVFPDFDLYNSIRDVQGKGLPVSTMESTQEGQSILVRIHPYDNQEHPDHAGGIVISFADVTGLLDGGRVAP